MKRLIRFGLTALLALLLIGLSAACANPIGSRSSTGSIQPPAIVRPANGEPTGGTSIRLDPQADAIERALTDLDNPLNSTDTLDDLK